MGDFVNEQGMKIPNHIAIILDGNGRWAKKRFLPRKVGHSQGAKTVEVICEEAYRLGVNYLTVYAFSTENWKRPQDEVDAIMKLLRDYMKNCIKISTKNNMRVRVIGNRLGLDADIIESIEHLEETSKNNTGLNFQVALNYGSRDEILRATKKLMQDYKDNKITLEELDATRFSSYLDTKEIPDPDMMIRTSGEQRVSNYLLWQLAYTEFYFTDVLWPDFSKEELLKAIEHYNGVDRRFGKV